MKNFLFALVCCLLAGMAQADNVTFSYQGSVKVGNQSFTGTGQFKLAIMDTSGSTILWSNDGTMSGEPAASISNPVTDGVFSILVGDTNVGMQPINSSIFAARTPLKLRVWFNANGLGFQQLNPDQNLVDLSLNTVATGTQDFTIYVDGTNGNDSKNGLTPATAKKKIQAALDTIPAQLRCNVTVKIMPGDYAEPVSVHGISASGTLWNDTFEGNYLRIVGDESWTTTSVGNPNVRILGSNTVAGPAVRRYAFNAHNCSAVMVDGIWFDKSTSVGSKTETGNYIVKNCKATNNSYAGFGSITGGFTHYISCLATANTHGFYTVNGGMYVTGSIATANTNIGVFVQGPGFANVYPGTQSNDNNDHGFAATDNGVMGISGGSPAVQGMINDGAGISAGTGAVVHKGAAILTGNSDGPTDSLSGGHIY